MSQDGRERLGRQRYAGDVEYLQRERLAGGARGTLTRPEDGFQTTEGGGGGVPDDLPADQEVLDFGSGISLEQAPIRSGRCRRRRRRAYGGDSAGGRCVAEELDARHVPGSGRASVDVAGE